MIRARLASREGASPWISIGSLRISSTVMRGLSGEA